MFGSFLLLSCTKTNVDSEDSWPIGAKFLIQPGHGHGHLVEWQAMGVSSQHMFTEGSCILMRRSIFINCVSKKILLLYQDEISQ